MKKRIRIMAALMLTVMMVATTLDCAYAASYQWTAAKAPGSRVGETITRIPLYKGTMRFTLTALSGDCSYLLGKVTSNDTEHYYVNNSAKCVMLTKVNGYQDFIMEFINNGDSLAIMQLKCTVEHNAPISATVYARGTITY